MSADEDMAIAALTDGAQPAASLIALAAKCAARGWTPATSGNFSVRLEPTRALITRSGRDKGALTPDDVTSLDLEGAIPAGVSAEAPVHVSIYRLFPEARALVHIHAIASTVLSRRHQLAGRIAIDGLEMQKALRGVTTHDAQVELRIYPNTQDMDALARRLPDDVSMLAPAHGFLLAGHGLYTWGASASEAFRHAEALDYLLTVRMHEEQLAR